MKKLIIFALPLLLAGCYPNGPDYVEQLDLVVTNYDPDFSFTSTSTYSLPDKVVIVSGEDIDDPDGNGEPEYVDDATAALILSGIRDGMNGYGYTEVDETSDPDLIILPAAMQTTYLYYYYDWWYWSWYYPGYPGYGWGWYYPGYYPPYYSSYTTGTLLVSMTDPNNQKPDDNIPVVWTGVGNGLMNYGNSAQRITDGVNQMFAQSPYLTH